MPRPQENPDWFAEQFRQNRPIIANRCRYATRASDHICEDAADFAFIKAWQNNPDFPNTPALVGWLRKVAVNHVKDLRRRVRRHARLIDSLARTSGVDGGEADDRDTELQFLEMALKKLDPEEQEILSSHYRKRMTDQQIAGQLGLTRLRVLRIRHRAISHLRALFDDLAGGVTPIS